MSKNIAIKVEHLSKTFTLQHPVKDETGNDVYDLCALKDVSFEVKRGESVGIIGANGSGKSTLLKILAGITKPTSGEVTIYGRIASILDIGAGFHPELSGKENVFLNGQILGFTQKEIQNKYDDIVEFSGIGSFINEPVKSYSNGMYLRLAFSIMAHLDFDVYLFDEVFSVGDAEFALRTKEKFMQLIASDKTMLFVSHNMSELSNQNLYILLEKGNIKGLTKDTSILSEYLESGLKKSGGEVFIQNTTLIDFSKFPNSTEIKVLKVELLQEGTEQYRTDKPFTLKLEFENLIEQDTIDIVLRIHDIQGNIIMSATSLLSNHSSKSGKGIYSYTCVLPACFFGFQPYKLGVFFVKNAAAAIHESESALTLSLNSMENMASSAYVLDNLLTFKPQFKLGDVEVNLSNLNINGGLLPVLDWTLSFSKP